MVLFEQAQAAVSNNSSKNISALAHLPKKYKIKTRPTNKKKTDLVSEMQAGKHSPSTKKTDTVADM